MPVRSPHPDVDIPGVDLETFLFGRDLGEHADVPAFVDGTTGASLTFGTLHDQVLRIAAALAQRGIGRGDVVALYAPNSPAWAAVFHGVLRANATLTSVNALYTAGELAAQLARLPGPDGRHHRGPAGAGRVGREGGRARRRCRGRPGRRGRPRLASTTCSPAPMLHPHRRSGPTTLPCCPTPRAPPAEPRA